MSAGAKGFLATSILGPALMTGRHFGGVTSMLDESASAMASDTIPVKLSPLDDPSEAPKPPPPAPLDPAKRIGFAIVGLGHLALEEIMPAFAQSMLAKPVALVSGDPVKAKKVAMQYGIAETSIYNYQNFDEISKDPSIQAVYIVLPNSMHREFTVRAAKAGKHVLCEKPMATSAKECQEMIDACKTAGKKLMIAYRIQYEPNNAKMKQWVRSAKYGKTRIIEMFNSQNIGDPNQWRLKKALAGGGALPDIGLYCLNTARYLTGEEPEWISASIYNTPGDIRFKEVKESVFFQLRFPSGTIATCTTSYGVHENRRYRCQGDKGGWFGLDPAFPYNGLKIEMNEVREGSNWQEMPKAEQKDQFALELDHFSDCIMHDKRPYTPGEEGLQDQLLMEAIYRSAKEGKAITMNVPAKPDAFRGNAPKQGS